MIVPIALVNSTAKDLSGNLVVNSGEHLELLEQVGNDLELKALERSRKLLKFKVKEANTEANLVASANFGPFKDSVTRTTKIVPLGFPHTLNAGGMLKPVTYLTSITHPLLTKQH